MYMTTERHSWHFRLATKHYLFALWCSWPSGLIFLFSRKTNIILLTSTLVRAIQIFFFFLLSCAFASVNVPLHSSTYWHWSKPQPSMPLSLGYRAAAGCHRNRLISERHILFSVLVLEFTCAGPSSHLLHLHSEHIWQITWLCLVLKVQSGKQLDISSIASNSVWIRVTE